MARTFKREKQQKDTTHKQEERKFVKEKELRSNRRLGKKEERVYEYD